jgi:glucokinase
LENGNKLFQVHDTLDSRQGKAVGALMRHQAAQLMRLADSARVKVKAVGVSVPGIAWRHSGTVWAPNIPGWEAYPLRNELRRATHQPRVIVDNDRACSILGEVWRGAARHCRNAVFLAVGTGIGAGILVDGKVVRGAHDIAGSIGWMALDRPFRREYIECGCFEQHASGEGLAKTAKKVAQGGRSRKRASVQDLNSWAAHEIFAGFERGDRVAQKVFRQAVEFWGMAVANLVSLLDPEKIIFGGGVFGPAGRFLDDIYAEAKKWAQPIAIRRVSLQVSKLGPDAALYGAGYLALRARNY